MSLFCCFKYVYPKLESVNLTAQLKMSCTLHCTFHSILYYGVWDIFDQMQFWFKYFNFILYDGSSTSNYMLPSSSLTLTSTSTEAEIALFSIAPTTHPHP